MAALESPDIHRSRLDIDVTPALKNAFDAECVSLKFGFSLVSTTPKVRSPRSRKAGRGLGLGARALGQPSRRVVIVESSMRRTSRLASFSVCAAWMLALVFGFVRLWQYEGAAGAISVAPTLWPANSSLHRDAAVPNLLLFLHPKCPCSRASVEELAKLMATYHRNLVATALIVRPLDAPQDWEHTDLVTSAAAIPGVTVLIDPNGAEAKRFGAATSGQVMLYSATGTLQFAGGITASRGHSGDNAGRATIGAILMNEFKPLDTEPAHTPVYGCPLFHDPVACDGEGANCQ